MPQDQNASPPPAVPPKEAFAHCPRCASRGNAAPPDANWFDCAACGFRFHFNAAVSVSAVIARPDGCLFLIQRARDPGKGKLAFPGGFVDPHERAEDACIREIREEVGLEVTRLEYLTSHTNPYTYRGILYPVLDLFYIGYVTGGKTEVAPDEVAGAYWRDPSGLDPTELSFDSMRAAFAAYLRRNS